MGWERQNAKNDTNESPGLFSSSVLVPSTIVCSSVFFGAYFYRTWLKRIPTSLDIPATYFKRRTLYGKVVTANDPDNFRFYHTPGGILGGWGWLRRAPKINDRNLKDQCISVRLCGVDAPELSHFGKPAQPWSQESLEWLRKYILGRNVRILPLATDQYLRTVAQAKVLKWNGYRNVSAELLRAGNGVVYEAKTGAEFNGNEALFRKLEAQARKSRIGMFKHSSRFHKVVTPGEYKRKNR